MARTVDLFNTQASQKTKCALETKSSVNSLQYKVLKTSDQLIPKEPRGLRGLSDWEVRQMAQIEIIVKVNDNITTLHGLNSTLVETQKYTKLPINIS